jgi:hypothetical protein
MDPQIETRKDVKQRTLVDLGITLRRDWGIPYARCFLESVGTNESVIERVTADGAVCP